MFDVQNSVISTIYYISFISYSLVAFLSTIFGLIYLIKDSFMPYHSEALKLSWSDLETDLQVLIIALMRAASGGFLATGLAMMILLIIPFQARNSWSIYAIFAISLCTSVGTLYATLLVKTKTPGNPPFILSFAAVALTVIGFICSLV